MKTPAEASASLENQTMGKGIYTRGFLPHWGFERSTQAIASGLDDSERKGSMWQREYYVAKNTEEAG